MSHLLTFLIGLGTGVSLGIIAAAFVCREIVRRRLRQCRRYHRRQISNYRLVTHPDDVIEAQVHSN